MVLLMRKVLQPSIPAKNEVLEGAADKYPSLEAFSGDACYRKQNL